MSSIFPTMCHLKSPLAVSVTLVGVLLPMCERKHGLVELRRREPESRYWKHFCGLTTHLMDGERRHASVAAAAFVMAEYAIKFLLRLRKMCHCDCELKYNSKLGEKWEILGLH